MPFGLLPEFPTAQSFVSVSVIRARDTCSLVIIHQAFGIGILTFLPQAPSLDLFSFERSTILSQPPIFAAYCLLPTP